jgi:ATP-dependent DNA helicase DinG
MTSATLSQGGNFDFLKSRLGLSDQTVTLSLASPFDYANNTILYVPKPFPSPKEESTFSLAFIERLHDILKLSQGRALVLFTSYRMLHITAEALDNKLPWRLLVQGQKASAALLGDFTKDVHSVLLATTSFWQGVDVPGQSLSVVVIDRLPFARPNRPITKARSNRIEQNGGDPFNDYSLPEMTLTLKQGLGRLLRNSTDRGLLAVMDNRLISTAYGKKVLSSLPPSPITSDFSKVKKFLKKI